MMIDWERAARENPRHADLFRRQIDLAKRAERIMVENARRRQDEVDTFYLRSLWREGASRD